jgi:hypothetical protein
MEDLINEKAPGGTGALSPDIEQEATAIVAERLDDRNAGALETATSSQDGQTPDPVAS